MVAALILLVLLVVSGLANVGLFFSNLVPMDGYSSSRGSGPRMDEVVLKDNDARDKIAVINVDGIISDETSQGGYSMVELFKEQLLRAQTDKKVRAVMLKINSPGGEVLAADEMYKAIVEFQEKCRKPVIASMGSMAASGGYYISAPCRWIVANDLTITGSIGVIMSTWNYRGLMNKVGIRPYTFKSGKFKDMLSGSKEPSEITKEEEDMINALVDETFVRFKTVVGEGRKMAADRNKGKGKVLTENWDKLADGRVLSGTEAFKHGFVDELGNFDTAVKTTASMVGLSSDMVNLIEYRQRVDLAELFQLFGNTESKAVKVDLGLKSSPLRAGYLYFIAPTLIQ